MLSLLFTIAQSVLVILQAKTGSNPNPAVNIAAELVKIAQAASDAHRAETGKPINPDLIKPIEPIP